MATDEPTTGTDRRVTGLHDADLHVRRWEPDGAAKGAVLLVHGLGEHTGRYEHVARFLTGRGFAVTGYDHRGHGRSSGVRAHVDRYEDFLHDLETMRAEVSRTDPGLPLFLLGHSMGGNIALGFALDHQEGLAGLVLSGPAIVVADDVPGVVVGVSKVVARVAPKARVLALDPAKVSRDPAVVAAYSADPFVHHGKVTAGLAVALLGSMQSFPDRIGALHVPMLVMHGTADELAPVAGSELLEAGVGTEDLTVRYFDGLAHEIFNEPEQDEVLAVMGDWLDARV